MRNATFLAAGLCLSLGACTDEPSEASMRQAASNLITRAVQAQLMLVGPSRRGQVPLPTFSTFRKIGCEPALPSLGGYQCGFEAAINGGPTIAGKGRFFKAADGTLAMVE